MDIKEIKQIVDLMKRSDLTEFELQEKELKLRICRNSGTNGGYSVNPFNGGGSSTPVNAPDYAPAPAAPTAPKEDAGTVLIKSPMVGSFYRSPNPDSKPFLEVGSKVKPDTVVCIIEAMKVMNEITSEVSGTVVEILVENGQAVEYGQGLFKVKP